MKLVNEIQNTASDTLTYLPELKQKLLESLTNAPPTEIVLIDSAFANYELYLVFLIHEFTIPDEWEEKRLALIQQDHIQLTTIVLHYKSLIKTIKKTVLLELDKKLLLDIFQYYRECMLYFKHQKANYQQIKTLLKNANYE